MEVPGTLQKQNHLPVYGCKSHIDKSQILQATITVGRTDVSSGLGDTFRCGFNKKLAEENIEWTKKGEEWFGDDLAPCSTEVRKEQMKDIDFEWTHDSLIKAGYAEIVRGNKTQMEK